MVLHRPKNDKIWWDVSPTSSRYVSGHKRASGYFNRLCFSEVFSVLSETDRNLTKAEAPSVLRMLTFLFPFKTWLSLMRWMRCQLVCQMALNATAYFWWTVKNAAGFQVTVAHGVFKRALQTLTGPWPGSCEPLDLPSISLPFTWQLARSICVLQQFRSRLVPKNFHLQICVSLWTRVWSTKYS